MSSSRALESLKPPADSKVQSLDELRQRKNQQRLAETAALMEDHDIRMCRRTGH